MVYLTFPVRIGPTDLTRGTLIIFFAKISRLLIYSPGTLSPDTGTSIPTVTDNLFAQGTITEHAISVSFEPITDSSGTQLNGELTWGQ
jgi:hypothetical protein